MNNPSYSPSAADAGGAAICAIQKDTLPYIDEWVDYNLALGFEKIYIYDNSDEFELKNWETKRNSTQVAVVHMPGENKQMKAYAQCGAAIKKNQSHEWMAFIDLDEFIVLKKHTHILDLLNDVDIEAGGLALNWQMFGFNNQMKYTPVPVTKRFQIREVETNIHVKTIVRTSKFLRVGYNPHYAFTTGRPVDTTGRVLSKQEPYFNPGGPL